VASDLARIGRGHQHVAEPAHRLDDVDSQLLAHAADKDLDRVRIAIEVLIVEMLDEFGAGHHAPFVVHEVGEQPVFMGGELDRIAVDADAAGARVEPDRPAGQFALGVPGGAAQQGADAGEDFLEMEGLGDIIVGAGVEPLDLVAPAIARRQDQDGHGAAGAPPRLQHGDAVQFRQADVEDDRVVGLVLAEIMAFLAVKGAVDDVAGIGESRRQLTIKIRIVLDNEQPHPSLRSRESRRSRPRAPGS